jgi:hypothetical protein
MHTQGLETGAGMIAGLMGESALGTLAGLQFPSALSGPLLPAELTWYLAMTEQIVEAPRIVEGAIELPDAASIASIVDWEKLERVSPIAGSRP